MLIFCVYVNAEEMDWNKDGKVSFREFLFSLINWVGLESTDEVPVMAIWWYTSSGDDQDWFRYVIYVKF